MFKCLFWLASKVADKKSSRAIIGRTQSDVTEAHATVDMQNRQRPSWSKCFTAATTEGSSCCCLYTHATLTLLTQAVRAESTLSILYTIYTLTILIKWQLSHRNILVTLVKSSVDGRSKVSNAFHKMRTPYIVCAFNPMNCACMVREHISKPTTIVKGLWLL